MHVFDREVRTPSVPVAKERLKAILAAERTQCKPDTYEHLCRELFRTVSKYMKVTEEQFDVELTRSKITIILTGEES